MIKYLNRNRKMVLLLYLVFLIQLKSVSLMVLRQLPLENDAVEKFSE